MTQLVATLTTSTFLAAVLLFCFFGESQYEKIQHCMAHTAKSLNRFLLFILPLILSLIVFLPITAIKSKESFNAFGVSISSNYIDFVFLLLLAVFHIVKGKTKSSLSDLFQAYRTPTETKSVVFVNQVIACLIYITINHILFGINGAIVWWTFLIGRFVWLDQIDRSQMRFALDGLRTQGIWKTLLYACIFSLILIPAYFTAKYIPDYVSNGVAWGISAGSIISLIVLSKFEKHRHRRVAAVSAKVDSNSK